MGIICTKKEIRYVMTQRLFQQKSSLDSYSGKQRFKNIAEKSYKGVCRCPKEGYADLPPP